MIIIIIIIIIIVIVKHCILWLNDFIVTTHNESTDVLLGEKVA